MSSDNAQFAVTYTSISSDSDGPSWGIPLMNADEFPEMDPYEEVAQQGQVYLLSLAYVLDPMELDEHVPVHVLKPEHLEYHAPSDDDIQVEDDDEDPNEEHEPEDRALIDAFDVGLSLFSLPPTSPAYDQAPLGHRTTMIRMKDDILEEDMPPQRRFVLTASPPGYDVAESFAVVVARAPKSQYDFVDTIEAGQGLIRSPGHDTQTIAGAADRAEDVGYIRALHAFERRMMTSIKEVNLRFSYQAQVRRQKSKYFYTQFHDAQTNRRDIRLEINVTLETHVSRMEWQRQSAEDLAVTQMMRIHSLAARAWTDMVEDTSSSC
uniref:Uncharacterized protein n=1 Tax=Tanacetum cinerariifolium TaxID=118510 RepID=A0A6L2KXN3_TANCI|nr:hypothetical protein [Tanacetum cinerariifolium]